MQYPIMADRRSGSNTEIDPAAFWLLGASNNTVSRAPMNVSIAWSRVRSR
jgi:hypothetical protein